MKIITQDEIEQRIMDKYPNQPFKIIEYTKVSKPFTIQCLNCGEISQFSNTNNFLFAKRKGVCACYNEKNNRMRHLQAEQEINELIKQNSYLEFYEYQQNSTDEKIQVKCKCNHCNQFFLKLSNLFYSIQIVLTVKEKN